MEVGILVMLINNKAIYVDKQSGMFYKKLRMCNAFNWKNYVITCDFCSESFTDTLLLEVPML